MWKIHFRTTACLTFPSLCYAMASPSSLPEARLMVLLFYLSTKGTWAICCKLPAWATKRQKHRFLRTKKPLSKCLPPHSCSKRCRWKAHASQAATPYRSTWHDLPTHETTRSKTYWRNYPVWMWPRMGRSTIMASPSTDSPWKVST